MKKNRMELYHIRVPAGPATDLMDRPAARRQSRLLVRLALVLAALGVMVAASAPVAHAVDKIVISAPGPRNISYLPIDLIPRIGADREEGVTVSLIHTGGGAVALNNLITNNADFAVAGVPAAMSLRAHGGDVFVVAAVDDAPLFVLMVRRGLKDQVRRIADLKGKTIGVNTSTKQSKTTSQQLAELLLRSDGVALDMVRIVPAGQSWIEQSSLMLSGMADAVMGDEPFASRLLAKDAVFFLASLADPETTRTIAGAHFLHAAVETRGELIKTSPAKVEKMVRMLRRSLNWLAAHSAEEIAETVGVIDQEEREALVQTLKKYPRAFSREGGLSTAQIKETELFFHQTNEGNPAAQALRLEEMVNDTWAGRVP